jgi:hypothetical protein
MYRSTGSGVHPTSCKMGTGGSFPGVKRQGREADHSPPTGAEVKKMWKMWISDMLACNYLQHTVPDYEHRDLL